jgi:hypothetical protein
MRQAPILIASILLFCSCSASVASAVDATAPPAASAEDVSLQGFASSAPRCAEWSDGCSICLREGDAAHCSTPGLACQPGPIVCRREADK